MAKPRLTRLQTRRIQDNLTQHQRSPDHSDTRLKEGLVIAHHGNKLIIENTARQRIPCTARRNIGNVVCGDQVLWESDGHEGGVVTAVQPRSSLLIRPGFADKIKPVAANITLMVVIIAVKPAPQPGLIDRYLVAAESLGIQPILVINKTDLLAQADISRWLADFAIYADIGYDVIQTSCKTIRGLDALSDKLSNNTAILVGQSGVGKSSLINALLPDLSLKVQALSEQIGQGQHTTSHSEMYKLADESARIIDSPGVRDFRLGHLEKPTIEKGFIEFRPFIGRCKFSDCSHQHEPDCALQHAVSENLVSRQRLESYLEIINS